MSNSPVGLQDGKNIKGDTITTTETDEGDEEPQKKLDKASAQNAADMERVTNVSEEKEFSGSGNASAVRKTCVY
jgi:hypothetical protein